MTHSPVHTDALPHPLPQHPASLPSFTGPRNLNVDPRVDGRLPGGGRKPHTGAITNPSEWSTKPDYQIKFGEHADGGVQSSFADVGGQIADAHMYFHYPDLGEYWSADEGEVPEPYVAAAYVKWFVSSWRQSSGQEAAQTRLDSLSLKDIAVAIERREPSVMAALSRCATDHFIVSEISRDTVPRALKQGKEDGNNASVVPFAIQHRVEILPRTKYDVALADQASIVNDRRLLANSHGASVGSIINPAHPDRSERHGYPQGKYTPEHKLEHVMHELDEASRDFARLAFQNGGLLETAILDAVSRNTEPEYDGLPKYVGEPVAQSVNYRNYQYLRGFNLENEKTLNLYVDPVNEAIIDSVGQKIVVYDTAKRRTILCLGQGAEIAIDGLIDPDEAVELRRRHRKLFMSLGKISSVEEISPLASLGFEEAVYSDVPSRRQVISARGASVLTGVDVHKLGTKDIIAPKTRDIPLSNGEMLTIATDGTLKLRDGTVIARQYTSTEDGQLYTVISGPQRFCTTEFMTPLRAYKNYIFLNKEVLRGSIPSLNEIWGVQVQPANWAPPPPAP